MNPPAATPTATPAAASAAPTPTPTPGAQANPSPPSNPAAAFSNRSSIADGIDSIEGTDNPSGLEAESETPSSTPQDLGGDGGTDPNQGGAAPKTDPAGKPPTGLGDDIDPLLGKPKPAEGPKQLRSAYEKATKDLAEARTRIAQFEKTIEEAKKSATSEVAKQLESLQAKLETYEQQMQLVDFRQSNAYREQFHAPAQKAWEAAGAALRGVKVENPDGSERPIEAKEIAELAAMEPADAWAAAQRFGSNAPLVHHHVQAIREKELAKQSALTEWGEKGKQHKATLEQQRLDAQKDWETGTDQILAERAEDLGIANPDDETKTLLDHGAKLAKLAFLGGQNASREQILAAQKLAAVRVRTFGAVLTRAQRAEALANELKAKLAQYEAGDPPVGGGGGGGWSSPASGKSAEDGIDAIEGFDQPN